MSLWKTYLQEQGLDPEDAKALMKVLRDSERLNVLIRGMSPEVEVDAVESLHKQVSMNGGWSKVMWGWRLGYPQAVAAVTLGRALGIPEAH